MDEGTEALPAAHFDDQTSRRNEDPQLELGNTEPGSFQLH